MSPGMGEDAQTLRPEIPIAGGMEADDGGDKADDECHGELSSGQGAMPEPSACAGVEKGSGQPESLSIRDQTSAVFREPAVFNQAPSVQPQDDGAGKNA